MTVEFRTVDYDHFLTATPSPTRMAYHADGETFDRYQVVAGEGIYQVRHVWDRSRALWRLSYRLLPDAPWKQDDGPMGWRFECLGRWHTDPRDCVLTMGLEAGEYTTLAEAETGWRAWIEHEQQEIAARVQKLDALRGEVTV